LTNDRIEYNYTRFSVSSLGSFIPLTSVSEWLDFSSTPANIRSSLLLSDVVCQSVCDVQVNGV